MYNLNIEMNELRYAEVEANAIYEDTLVSHRLFLREANMYGEAEEKNSENNVGFFKKIGQMLSGLVKKIISIIKKITGKVVEILTKPFSSKMKAGNKDGGAGGTASSSGSGSSSSSSSPLQQALSGSDNMAELRELTKKVIAHVKDNKSVSKEEYNKMAKFDFVEKLDTAQLYTSANVNSKIEEIERLNGTILDYIMAMYITKYNSGDLVRFAKYEDYPVPNGLGTKFMRVAKPNELGERANVIKMVDKLILDILEICNFVAIRTSSFKPETGANTMILHVGNILNKKNSKLDDKWSYSAPDSDVAKSIKVYGLPSVEAFRLSRAIILSSSGAQMFTNQDIKSYLSDYIKLASRDTFNFNNNKYKDTFSTKPIIEEGIVPFTSVSLAQGIPYITSGDTKFNKMNDYDTILKAIKDTLESLKDTNANNFETSEGTTAGIQDTKDKLNVSSDTKFSFEAWKQLAEGSSKILNHLGSQMVPTIAIIANIYNNIEAIPLIKSSVLCAVMVATMSDYSKYNISEIKSFLQKEDTLKNVYKDNKETLDKHIARLDLISKNLELGISKIQTS